MGAYDAISIIERKISQTKKSEKFKRIISNLKRNLSEGVTVGSSFDFIREKGAIDRISVSIIKSSEKSGNLKSGFEKVYKRLERIRQKDGQVITKIMYPVIVSISSVLLAYFLVLLIFPKILPLFSSMKVPVPKTTLFALGVVTFVSNNIVYILVVLFGLGAVFRYQYREKYVFKLFVHNLLLKVPVLSKVLFAKDSAHVTYSISILLESGIPVIEAVSSVKSDLSLIPNKIVFEDIEKGLQNGRGIADILEGTSFKNTDWIDFLYIGEKTGRLSESFEDLSVFYESELEETLNFVTGLSEPLLLFCVATVVLFIALSVIQPMYSIIQYVNP
jgi:type II secretory pathway component PulF